MPRVEAVRPASGRARTRKPAPPQDRLSARVLLLRRMRRNVKPGLWLTGGLIALLALSSLVRVIPALAPVTAVRHGLARVAADLGFRITDIQIIGADATAPDAIRAALGVQEGGPTLGFSLQDAAARVAALGSVQSAVVERELPGSIIVSVTERAPLAIWQTDGAAGRKFVLIDKAGQVIAGQDPGAAKRLMPGLLLLAGADAPGQAYQLLSELKAVPALYGHVVAADRIDGLRWNLLLRNDTLVKLPADGEQAAMAQLGQLQNSMALLDRPVEVIDLRLPGRLVVRPYPAPPPPPPAPPVKAGHT